MVIDVGDIIGNILAGCTGLLVVQVIIFVFCLKIPEFMFLEYYNNWSVMSVGNIMLLPPVMIPYIMSLVNSCSFEKLSQALNFGSIENFYIHSCESEGFKKPRCLYTDWISQEWKCR